MNGDAKLLEYMYWPEVRDAIAANMPLILPVGSIEQHGPHMPLGTDGFIPHELARRVAVGRDVIVAPPLLYAAYSRPRSGGGRSFPGSTGMPGSTLQDVVHAVAADFMRQGFRHLVVLNGHYENAWTLLEALEHAIVGFEETHKAVLVNWWDQVGDADVTRIFGDAFPGWNAEHASLTETSLMEALFPHLVRTEAKARGGAPRTLTYDVFPTPPDTVWPNGVGYDASGASAELGKELVELVVRRVGAILDEEFA